MSKGELNNTESFLRKREMYCVSACSRFSRIKDGGSGHVWYMKNGKNDISALLLHHRHSLFPIFNKKTNLPGPKFLNRFLGKVYIHAIQGIKEDVELLESLMEKQGYYALERIDYDLMCLNVKPSHNFLRPDIPGLIFRLPMPGDKEDLIQLQAAYEKEEVIPKNGIFNPASSRYSFNRLLNREQFLLAELKGKVIGKINTSSQSFTRFQIGGVYILPEYRGRGIAARMTALFLEDLLSQGKGITLFVKKRNAPARAVYRKLGFMAISDYRINYY